ncbi:hypothetical protein BH11ACT4_BH11ACT4_25790 [soil metagenome]
MSGEEGRALTAPALSHPPLVSNDRLTERIEKAIARALPLVQSSAAEREAVARTLAGEEAVTE